VDEYSKQVRPLDHDFVYEGDAALGWFNANQSSYPNTQASEGLEFENVDLRHQIYTDRVGIDTFGLFLHLGGPNTIPFTYVDNCAEAIARAGLVPGVDGEVFNVVDDDLPSSRRFLRLYKRNVRRFPSIYVPHAVSHALCFAWEKYSHWSEGQLPPVFNRRRWHAYWKQTRYTNDKLKTRLGWTPTVPMAEGLRRYFASCREGLHA